MQWAAETAMQVRRTIDSYVRANRESRIVTRRPVSFEAVSSRQLCSDFLADVASTMADEFVSIRSLSTLSQIPGGRIESLLTMGADDLEIREVSELALGLGKPLLVRFGGLA